MWLSLIPTRVAARHLTGCAFLSLLAGCGGDGLLLPLDGEPAELRVVSGDPQSAPTGAPLEKPLIVEALDRARRPVPGAVIVFEFVDPPSGAELAPANTETDSTGRASAEVKLGTPVGDQSVEARLDDPNTDLSVRFRLMALERPGGGGDGGGDGDDGGGGGGGGDGDDDDDESDSRGHEGKGKGKGKGGKG